jgi:hypothetical protein
MWTIDETLAKMNATLPIAAEGSRTREGGIVSISQTPETPAARKASTAIEARRASLCGDVQSHAQSGPRREVDQRVETEVLDAPA